jgi:branched-chain amino acid transport system substrate-binding protein
VPTARTWFGYVSVWTCALAAAKANSLKALDMAKALQDFHLPREVALGPNPAFYRAGQNQLLASLFVGEAQAKGSAPDDFFKVTKVVDGATVAGTLEESGCKMKWPT